MTASSKPDAHPMKMRLSVCRATVALTGLWLGLTSACNAECLRHSDCASGNVCWAGLCSLSRVQDAGANNESVDPRQAARDRFDSQDATVAAGGQGGIEPTLVTPDLDAGVVDSGSQPL